MVGMLRLCLLDAKNKEGVKGDTLKINANKTLKDRCSLIIQLERNF